MDRTGIQRGSLYATFGDKRAVFLAAIDRYDRMVTAKLLAALDEPASGMEAIRGFFRLKIEWAVAANRPRGCLVTNSATELASRDRRTASRVAAVLAKIEAAFERAVVRAQQAGEIDPARDPRALARFLTSSAQGLSVMAKTFPERAVLEDIVEIILTVRRARHPAPPASASGRGSTSSTPPSSRRSDCRDHPGATRKTIRRARLSRRAPVDAPGAEPSPSVR